MVITQNPELCLLAHSFDDVYKVAQLPKPSTVDWGRFEHLVLNNKLPLLAYTRVLEDPDLEIPPPWRARFQMAKERQETEWQRLASSLAQINRLLEDTPYVLVKTYRPYPYVTHDLDVLVQNAAAVGEMVTKAGIPWGDIPRGSVQVEEPQWLHLEFYERVLPGSIQVIDDELTLLNPVPTVLEGEPTVIASPEVEIVTLVADTVFRLYELKLGDMVYMYTLAERADWEVLAQQARKYGWYEHFRDVIGVLNTFHRELYGEPSRIETYLGSATPVPARVPYVPGWRPTIRALSRQGTRHLIKLPAYLSVRLKQNNATLHRAYVRFLLEPVGRFVLRHLYR